MGRPVYRYRGAEIRCNPGGHLCTLLMEGRPLHGATFGVVGTVTPLVDMWVEEGRLPSYMRPVPKPDAGASQDCKWKPPGRGAPGGSIASAPRRVGPAADRAGDTPLPRGRLRACDAAEVSSAPRGWPWRRQRRAHSGFPFSLHCFVAIAARRATPLTAVSGALLTLCLCRKAELPPASPPGVWSPGHDTNLFQFALFVC